jgi:two-component system, cell cycle sensor histidine kinase and response regulator CckA
MQLGQGPNEIVGVTLFEYFQTKDRTFGPIASHLKALKGKSVNYEIVWLGRTFESHLEPIRKNGKIVGVIGVAIDITERRQAEQMLRLSEESNRNLVENATDIVYTHDLNGRFTFVSPAAEQMTGYTREEAMQLGLSDIIVPEQLEAAHKSIAQVLQGTGHGSPIEFDIFAKGGRRLTVEVSPRAIYSNGKPVAIQGIARDITERKQVERDLKVQKAYLEELLQAAPEGILVLDEKGRVLRANREFERMFFFPFEELRGKNVDDLIVPENREREAAALTASITQNRRFDIETVRKRRDGTLLDVSILGKPVAMEPGKFGRFVIYRDISDHRRSERYRETQFTVTRILSESHSLGEAIDRLLELICTGIGWDVGAMWQFDTADTLSLHTVWQLPSLQGAQRQAVCKRGEGLPGHVLANGEPVWVADLEVDQEFARTAANHSFSMKSGLAFPVRNGQGTCAVIELFSQTPRYPDFEMLKVMADIGRQVGNFIEQKRTEELQSALYRIAECANSAEDLQQLFEKIHGIVSELMFANNFYIALYDEATGNIGFPYFRDEEDPEPPPPGKRRGLTEYVFRTATPQLISPARFRELVAQGEVQSIGAPSLDWLGVPLKRGDHVFGVMTVQSYSEGVRYGGPELEILTFVSQQIASAIEHRRSQDALRESEARYRSQVHSAVYGIYRSVAAGRFLDVNPAMIEMLGYDCREQMFALDIAKDVYVDPHERERLMTQVIDSERIEGIETRWKRRNGKVITVRLSGLRRHTPEGDCWEMIAEDVTERRLLEEQLRQSQKMEAVGRLAGGVAHDFNNLLTVIKGYTDLLLDPLNPVDPMYGELDEIRKAADRAAGLTRQLLAFSRRQVLAPKVLDLNQIITNMQKLVERLLGEDVELSIRLHPQLGSVKADPGQIEQVLMNLAVNARDAMLNGGNLMIETANFTLDEPYMREHAVVPAGRYVMIAVSDTGIGMDAETSSRVFEPFFTTKEKGTGLGLSTVYGIVKQSGGYIWVYSEPGQGTTFKVYLPLVEEPAEDAFIKPAQVAAYQGRETVLLVEDEDGVRSLVREVLKRHGYKVLETRHGGEALVASEKHKGKIDLLLTDVVLAQMNGREIARRLCPQRPDMKVLFVSGYTEEAIHHHGVLDPGTAFLQKPFTPTVLARKVREVLDGQLTN